MLELCEDEKYDTFLSVLKQRQESIANRISGQQQNGLTDRAATASGTVAMPSLDPNHGKLDVKLSKYPEDNFDVLLNITPTSEAFYRDRSEKAFPMTSKPRGTALIFNIFKTTGMKDRDGTMVDRDNLVKLFTKLHFNVKVYNDVRINGETELVSEPERVTPTAENILKLIRTTLDGTTSSDHCFVLVTLSHGGINGKHEEVIYGCDGEPGVTKKEILDVITDNKKYPDLKDMPRLVFFQCCRGEEQMQRLMKDGMDCVDIRENTLYCHSCTRAYVSHRDPKLGSRFVRALVSTFANHAHNTDIVGLMDMVKEAMRTIDPRSEFDQIPQSIFDRIFAEKKLYFFPGP